MTIRSKRHLLLPLLVLGLTLAVAAAVPGQGSAATAASFQVSFGTAPHWTGIPGTRVREIRQSDRPDYDMFQYGGRYYAYNNNQWYSSRRAQGQFTAIDEGRVPKQFSHVSRDHWHNYPSGWNDQNGHNGNRGNR